MACGLYERTATSTILVLLIVLDTTMVYERASAAPAKRNDILAGTEFLSVFINGAMASTPRRRGFRRGGHAVQDNVASESRQSEASIYRISRAPSNSRSTTLRPSHREVAPRLYPISHKSINHQQDFAPVVDDLGVADDLLKSTSARTNGTKQPGRPVNRKVIGVSVTSSVEATPYKVRVEHYDNEPVIMVTRPPVESFESLATSKSLAMITTVATTIKTAATSLTTTMAPKSTTSSPATVRLVTEELNNVVSESNRSEFSIDEDPPKTNWHTASSVTPGQFPEHSEPLSTTSRDFEMSSSGYKKSVDEGINSEPAERGYEVSEMNSEPAEIHEEPSEHSELQGRKAGRGYDASVFNQPPKVYPQPSKMYGKPAEIYSVPSKVYGEPSKIYSEPEKIYGEPSKIYSEPAKVYGEPAKMYSEPAKIYSEPAKIYSEPEKVYSEPAKIYSEPAKIYSEPSKFYSEPSKIYHSNGESINREPVEQNYEADEAVSVGTNGNVHGPQTESPNTSVIDMEDGHKVSYVVEGRKYRKYRVEERTPDGFIVGEYGVVSNDDGSLRGVRYTADGTINPRLIYETLMKFLAL